MSGGERKPGNYILDDCYQFGFEKCGDGAYATVWAARDRSGKDLAIKEIMKTRRRDDGGAGDLSNKEREHIAREIQVQCSLRHPGLVKLHRAYECEESYLLLMERVHGPSLLEIVSEGALCEAKARHYFVHVVDAVAYMHRHGFAHRDLKLENIVITGDDKPKICDFGLVADVMGEEGKVGCLTSNCGTAIYMAPEVFDNTNYDGIKADMWSMGVVLYSMCAGQYPFAGNDRNKLKQKVRSQAPVYPDHFSPPLVRLLEALLKKDPNDRPEVTDLFDSFSWMDNFKPTPGETPREWTMQKFKEVDNPSPGILCPLTVFQLAGAVRPLRLEQVVWDACENIKPCRFPCKMSQTDATKAICKCVSETFGDNARCTPHELYIECIIDSDDGELMFEIRTCGIKEDFTIVSIELLSGNPEYLDVLRKKLEDQIGCTGKWSFR